LAATPAEYRLNGSSRAFSLPFREAELSLEAHARLFASDLPRVAKLVASSGIKQSEVKQSASRGGQASFLAVLGAGD
jgi:hypothetical protein